MQIHGERTLMLLQHEPGNLKREMSSSNTEHYKQET